ncbi:MAG: mobile mystery protein A [Gemmatimonadota bacterium]
MDRLQALRLRQLQTRLDRLVPLAEMQRPREGWVRFIRETLGLTAAQLANRLGLSQPAVSQLEKAEQEGRITLNTLREAASALHCNLVYGLIPRDDLESVLQRRARQVAEQRMERVWHSMMLEGQEVSAEEKDRQIEDLTRELLAGNPRDLWREE